MTTATRQNYERNQVRPLGTTYQSCRYVLKDYVSCLPVIYQQSLPSKTVESYKVNIAERTMTMTGKTRYVHTIK